jgi:hypothetical protein
VFPPESDWNRDISWEPVDPHSADYLSAMQASSLRLWPDLGTPINVVGAGQKRVPMTFTWAAGSDPGPYPFPQNLGKTNVDAHAVVLDRDSCTLYETYNTFSDGAGGFRADVGAVWNLWSAALRPDGWTAATAAGLPLLAGIFKYEEAQVLGEIRHALVIASPSTAHAYVHPATHSSGTSNATYAPPMGLRIRLRADFDLSRFTGASRAVLRALQKHGAFITDNQSGLPFWPVWGAQDARWDVSNLNQLKSVPTTAFEVVRLGKVRPGS